VFAVDLQERLISGVVSMSYESWRVLLQIKHRVKRPNFTGKLRTTQVMIDLDVFRDLRNF
jgi:hypothetical protein